jgi:hypothetical protein
MIEIKPQRASGLGPRPVEALRKALQECAPAAKAATEIDRTKRVAVKPASLTSGVELCPHIREETDSREPLPVSREQLQADDKSEFRSPPEEMKPGGPDPKEFAEIVAAIQEQKARRRGLWRKKNLTSTGLDEQPPFDGKGRVNVAKQSTQQGYFDRGLGLIKRYKHELNFRGGTEDIDPRLFANWVSVSKFFVSDGAWRNYRQAAIAVIYTIPSSYIDEAIGMLNLDLHVGGDDGGHGLKSQKDGQIKAAKRMEHRHFMLLTETVRGMKETKTSRALGNWLTATISTGVRPMEWPLSFIERRLDSTCPRGERIWLHVVAGQGEDALTAYRTLDLSSFSAGSLSSIEEMVDQAHAWALSSQFARWQSEATKLLRKTCTKLFPRMELTYTLFSLRHQFLANMASIHEREEIAAMAGYVSMGARAEFYSKRRPYWRNEEIPEIPLPVADQVSWIRQRLRFFDQRLEIESMKTAARRRREATVARP